MINLTKRFYSIKADYDLLKKRAFFSLQGELKDNMDFFETHKMEKREEETSIYWSFEDDELRIVLTEEK